MKQSGPTQLHTSITNKHIVQKLGENSERKMGKPLFGALELVKGVGTKLLVGSDDLFMSLLTID